MQLSERAGRQQEAQAATGKFSFFLPFQISLITEIQPLKTCFYAISDEYCGTVMFTGTAVMSV